jgi:hypothetical protein
MQPMKPITIRGVPPALERVLAKTASESGDSLNRVVISLLEEAAGLRRKRRVLHHDLDALAGAWTAREATAFDKGLAEDRRIEPEHWK